MENERDLRVSDQERDAVVERLRGHLMAGRLDHDEHEERVAQACSATYGGELEHALRELPRPVAPAVSGPPVFVAPPSNGSAGTALALGIGAIGVLIFTVGFLAVLSLPLSALAWRTGARASREADVAGRGIARTGMWLGITGTLLSVLALTGWLALFGLVAA